ncbi:MAG: cation:proton antiporter [Gammaproteobacteria bacterium]|nr:cation:proton antiporter [Gammaproteobacteria bacterium]MDE0226605.1 cation:proton antiporter [Gammaproteobacteria bacterium]
MQVGIIESFFLIFAGAAVLATVALFTRQPLLVAYMAIGALLGPHGFAWIPNAEFVSDIGHIGIIFLLFLVGLDLPPAKLRNMLGASVVTALASTAFFFALGFVVLWSFGFGWIECLVAGIACVFSSTIVGIKMLPTTVLHHRHVGEIVISLLLIQDLIAIVALLALAGFGADQGSSVPGHPLLVVAAFPVIAAGAFLGVKFIVTPLLARFDAFNEFIFLLVIGWCLAIATVSHLAGMSLEVGAIIAGVSLASSPIAQFVTDNLRPLRDFFLILFFFSVGAAIDPAVLAKVIWPALCLGGAMLVVKPPVFRWLLAWQGESRDTSWEIGCRLGQASEFSLLVTTVALSGALVGGEAAHVIQGATVLTLVASTYLVIFRYPSPIAISDKLRRD